MNDDFKKIIIEEIEKRAEGLLDDDGVDLQVCAQIADDILDRFGHQSDPYPTDQKEQK